MRGSVDKSSGYLSVINGPKVVYGGITWSVLSLLFFLLLGIQEPGKQTPHWYLIGTYILEFTPFITASLLCYRNWCSRYIVSGRRVWLGIGLGTLSFFIGGVLFGWWEIVLHLEPRVSLADFFYLLAYGFLGWGMVLAVLSRRLNLEYWQWLIVGAIASVGLALAVWISMGIDNPPATTQPSVPEFVASTVASASPTPLLVANTSLTQDAVVAQTQAPVPQQTPLPQTPQWALSLQQALSPTIRFVNFFYIFGDVVLLIIASILLVAFWGGRYAQSWRMIAAATFCLYIADMALYVEARSADYYESGSLIEVFYIFSGVLFAIGAALEYDVSSRSRRGTRRRA